MNKKFLPGLIAAVVAIGLAIFVAVYISSKPTDNNTNNASQSAKATDKSTTGDKKDTAKEDTSKDTTDQTSSDDATADDGGVPADERDTSNGTGTVAVITKPGNPTTPSTPSTPSNPPTGGVGGGDDGDDDGNQTPTPVVTTEEETVVQAIAYTTSEVNDDTLDQGQRVTTQAGVNGSTTTVYTVTYTDGVQTSSVVKSVTTVDAINEIVHVGTKVPTQPPAQDCAVLTGTNLITNGNVETVTGDQPSDWTAGGYNVTYSDTYATPGCNGSGHSLKADITALGTEAGDAKWMSKAFAVTPGTTYQVSDWYKSNIASEVDVLLTCGGTDTFGWVGDAATSDSWVQFKGQFDVPAGCTSAQVFHVIGTVGSLSTDDYSVIAGAATDPGTGPEQPPVDNGFTGGLVSLTFDDGLTSTYDNGLPILKKYGFASTLYLISDTLKNNDDYQGEYMTVADVNNWLAQIPGTELGAHTVHHCDLTGQQTDDPENCPLHLSAAAQKTLNDKELTQSKTDLQAMFPGHSFDNFASPYGAYNAAVLSEIATAGYTSHRSTDGGFNTFGQVDPMNIVVQNVENTTQLSDVQAWVNEAKATNTWLVLVYHDVDTVAGQYGVTTANLDAQLGYISTSGVKVVTIAQALAVSK